MSYKSDIADVMDAMRKLIRLNPDKAVEMTQEVQVILELLIELAEVAGRASGKVEPYPEGSFKANFQKYVDMAFFGGN